MSTRVALIGATGHGAFHRRVIAGLQEEGRAELVGLGDLREIPDAPPGVPVLADHRELLARTKPDVVVVSTPPRTHLSLATDALRAGADVLLEKPPVLDLAEHDRLAAVLVETGRLCQVGFQALASPALAALLHAIDDGALGALTSIAVRGAWFRDEAYFHRAPWVGKGVDGALTNPFAHAVMQVLAIARQEPSRVELERYHATDIEVDDTASLRLTFPGGARAVIAVSLCAEEFVPGDITVTGTGGQAFHRYPTDLLRLPGESEATARPGRPGLLANLLAHRGDPSGVPLLVPLERTRPFTGLLPAIIAAPVRPIDGRRLSIRTDLPAPRVVIDGINAAIEAAAANLALFSEGAWDIA